MMTTRQNWTLEKVESLKEIRAHKDSPLWEPVRHGELLRKVIDITEDRGWVVSNFACHLTGDVRGMACSFDVKCRAEPPPETIFSMGLMHSNDKRFGMKLFGGLRIPFYRSNVVLSEYSLGKHTANAITRLDDQLHKAIIHFARDGRKYEGTIDGLEDTKLTPAQINDLLMTAGRAKLMGGSRVIQTDRLFDKVENNAWNLLVSFGVAMKKGEPIHQMGRAYTFYRMLETLRTREVIVV